MLQTLDRPKARQFVQDRLGDPAPGPEELQALAGREQHRQLVGGPVGDAGHQVGVQHVVDERDVLVADALDVVRAEAVGQHRRALQGLGGDDLGGVALLEVVTGAEGAGRAGGRHERAQPQAGLGVGQRVEHGPEGPAGALVVDEVVTELRELVEDDVAGIGGQFGALVVDLLDVALGARGADDVLGVGDPVLEPGEPLPAHALGQHGHPPAAHQRGRSPPRRGSSSRSRARRPGPGPDRTCR